MGLHDGSRTYVSGPGLEETVIVMAPDWQAEYPLSFWHPRIKPRFQSELVNDLNLATSGDSRTLRPAVRVAERLKPITFTGSGDLGEVAAAARLIEESGGQVEVDGGHLAGGIAGTVGQTFDLDALYADYEDYLAASLTVFPDLLPAIQDELERLAPLAFADLLEFGLVEVSFRKAPVAGRPFSRTPASLVRCGLLLGYPIASTAALILGDHGLPGGYTNY
jgi:hypothetical protein